jgi:arginase
MASLPLALIGYASGIAANNPGCGAGPLQLKERDFARHLSKQGIESIWQAVLTPATQTDSCLEQVVQLNQSLAQMTYQLVCQQQRFTVLGGDHSSALGTWSGVAAAKWDGQHAIGLIWIDAHMDSHTSTTSLSGNIHGMPLAALLGYGDAALTQIQMAHPKLSPEFLSLIGVRSFEEPEAQLLQSLGVRVYPMQEVKTRGLEIILAEAIQRAEQSPLGFGVSLDLDALDPKEAPGVGVPESDGLLAESLCQALVQFRGKKNLLGIEIVEYNPYFDKDYKTEQLIQKILLSILGV